MAGVAEIIDADFLQRNNLIKRSNLLWGKLCNPSRMGYVSDRTKVVSLKCSSRSSKVKAMAFSGNVQISNTVDEQPGLIEKSAREVIHLYRVPLIQESANYELLKSVQTKVSNQIVGLKTEQCFNIGLASKISNDKLATLRWILEETYEPENLGTENFLVKKKKEGLNGVIVEVGPRLSFTTAWSSNAISVCKSCGLTEVTGMERLRRYLFFSKGTLQESQINVAGRNKQMHLRFRVSLIPIID